MKTDNRTLAVGTLALAFLWGILAITPALARPVHHSKHSHTLRRYIKRRHAMKHHRYRIAAARP